MLGASRWWRVRGSTLRVKPPDITFCDDKRSDLRVRVVKRKVKRLKCKSMEVRLQGTPRAPDRLRRLGCHEVPLEFPRRAKMGDDPHLSAAKKTVAAADRAEKKATAAAEKAAKAEKKVGGEQRGDRSAATCQFGDIIRG